MFRKAVETLLQNGVQIAVLIKIKSNVNTLKNSLGIGF